MKAKEFKTICDTVVDLTKLELKQVPHLCIENFAPELLRKMLAKASIKRLVPGEGVSFCDTEKIEKVRKIPCISEEGEESIKSLAVEMVRRAIKHDYSPTGTNPALASLGLTMRVYRDSKRL